MKTLKRYCLALDLINDPKLINAYKEHHKKVWPEIIQSIKDSGIANMEIYLLDNRLFMIMEANDTFSFGRKSNLDAENAKVQEWENLMWKYQQTLPTSKLGKKWRLMEKIFSL
jgi:L-rhamnose mutarotase